MEKIFKLHENADQYQREFKPIIVELTQTQKQSRVISLSELKKMKQGFEAKIKEIDEDITKCEALFNESKE